MKKSTKKTKKILKKAEAHGFEYAASVKAAKKLHKEAKHWQARIATFM